MLLNIVLKFIVSKEEEEEEERSENTQELDDPNTSLIHTPPDSPAEQKDPNLQIVNELNVNIDSSEESGIFHFSIFTYSSENASSSHNAEEKQEEQIPTNEEPIAAKFEEIKEMESSKDDEKMEITTESKKEEAEEQPAKIEPVVTEETPSGETLAVGTGSKRQVSFY